MSKFTSTGAKPVTPVTPTAVKPTMPTQPVSPSPIQRGTAMAPTTSSATVNTPTFCMTPTHQQIAQRAYECWIKRGRPHGSHMQDWFEAETQLKREMTAKQQKGC